MTKASEYRVRELGEDFLWTPLAMAPLEDMLVPCERATITARWKAADVISTIAKMPEAPPRTFGRRPSEWA